ncbi:MAG TPA: SDR family NAD(P)-dependent oxidoreductase [Gammaproteobacteria bacterium]|nr:SDR family NAD(P)-dependent oxidoreductase [Gammaproteobacteria bacterium]
MRFTGRTVFITGASAGIGAELARRFAAEGANLVLAARRLDKLDELAAALPRPHGEVLTFACDVARDGSLEETVAQAKRAGARIDIVIANAGFGVAGALRKLELEDYRRQIETNVFGVLRTIYATLADLPRPGGQIAIIGSVAGWVPQPGASAYGMSKFAIRALAESLRGELAPEGIAVTLISPGFVDSDIRRTDNLGVLHEHAPDKVPAWLRMPTERAARDIVTAIHRRDRERIVTAHGKLIVFLYRHAPWLVRWVQRRGVHARSEPSR